MFVQITEMEGGRELVTRTVEERSANMGSASSPASLSREGEGEREGRQLVFLNDSPTSQPPPLHLNAAPTPSEPKLRGVGDRFGDLLCVKFANLPSICDWDTVNLLTQNLPDQSPKCMYSEPKSCLAAGQIG